MKRSQASAGVDAASGTLSQRAIRALQTDVDALDHDVERPRQPSDPYELILFENAGYLVDDVRREELFARITRLAPTPAALLGADHAALLAVARDGGMAADTRVERWRTIARLTLDAGGDLRAALRAAGVRERCRLLAAFPAIGAPGVAKIRLFALDEPCATVDSNGLRVLERLGQVPPGAPYATKYRDATRLLAACYASPTQLRRAWFVLRHHGKTICRRTQPAHGECRASRRCDGSLGREG